MIVDTMGCWLYAYSSDATTQRAYYTISVPKKTVRASVGVTAFSQGITDNRAGSVAVAIKRYGYYDSNGNVVVVEPPAAGSNNGMLIGNCAFVTFGLAATAAQAYARGMVFVYGQA